MYNLELYAIFAASKNWQKASIDYFCLINTIRSMRKKKMIRLLLACGLLMSPALTHAENEPKLVVNTADGASYEFFIADNPKMTYQDNFLVCQNDKGFSISVSAEQVTSFKFTPSNVDTGINSAKFPSSFGSVLSGLKTGSKVVVASIDGKIVKTLHANEAGTVELDFNQLPKGILIIKTEQGSLKIQH